MSDEIPEENITPAEEQELLNALTGGYPQQREKEGMYAFFNKILRATKRELSKVANLDERELEATRILLNTAEYAKEMGLDKVSDYILDKADTILGTSNSKAGFLIGAAVTQRRELSTRQQTGEGKKWPKKS